MCPLSSPTYLDHTKRWDNR